MSSISGGAWGAAWEEEATTAPEDVGCAVLEDQLSPVSLLQKARIRLGKDPGTTVVIPGEKELSMAGSAVHGVACPRGRTKKNPQQAFGIARMRMKTAGNGSVHFPYVYLEQTVPPRLCQKIPLLDGSVSQKLPSLQPDGHI